MSKIITRNTLLLLTLVSSCVINSITIASNLGDGYYVKGGLSLTEPRSKHYMARQTETDRFLTNNNLALNLGAGKRNDAVGAEIGYLKLDTKKFKDIYSYDGEKFVEYNSQNFYADLNGYLPIYHNFEAKLGLGLGLLETSSQMTKLDNNLNNEIVSNRTAEIQPRAIFGLNYNLSENVSLNYDTSFQKGNSIYRNIVTNNMGLAYKF